MSKTQLVRRVITTAHASGQQKTITDHILDNLTPTEIGGLGPYKEIYREISRGLMPGKAYSHLAGNVFLPDSASKKPAEWAKTLSCNSTMSVQNPNTLWKKSFQDYIVDIIDDSNSEPPNSPRKLPPNVIRELRNVSGQAIAEKTAQAVLSTLKELIGEWRTLACGMNEREHILEVIHESKRLTHQPEIDEDDADVEQWHGNAD